MRFLSFFIFVSLSVTAFANPMEWQNIRAKAIQDSKSPILPFKDSKGHFLARPQALAISSGLYQQKTDHDNSADTQTFGQRYWYLKTQPETAPVLLYVCGEGECGEFAIRGILANHAASLGANMVALEHRYYGASQPFSDLTTEHLKYLTVDYALKDIIHFQAYAQANLGLKGKWVAVGGSYPGALAAFLRSKYPNHFVGALASSAPVIADNDFSEYDRHVGQQAGPACVQAIQSVVAIADKAVQDPTSFADIKTKFNATPLQNPDDFLYLLADTAAAAVQYGMREEFCDLVTTSGLDGYAKGSEMVAGLFGNLVELSAQAAESTELAAGSIGMRQWFYQSCTEFGYWQNVTPEANFQTRSLRINENYHRGVCKRLFNLDQFADVVKTNTTYYEPILTSASDILFTNGSEDPWMNLSITDANLNNTNVNLTSYLINGAAHCDDLSRSAKSADAQTLFRDLAKKWLGI